MLILKAVFKYLHIFSIIGFLVLCTENYYRSKIYVLFLFYFLSIFHTISSFPSFYSTVVFSLICQSLNQSTLLPISILGATHNFLMFLIWNLMTFSVSSSFFHANLCYLSSCRALFDLLPFASLLCTCLLLGLIILKSNKRLSFVIRHYLW